MRMRVVDLFCGCGGMSLGFGRAGFDIVAAYDNWSPAADVYRANFACPVFGADLSDADAAARHIAAFRPQMIIGGPPCQDFSSAGKRDEDNGRGSLTVSYARIVAALKPEWFVMENVPAVAKSAKLAAACALFRQAGYGLTRTVLNAALCGVPQRRKRFVMIGRLGATDGFMLGAIRERLAAKEMTVREYFGERIGVDFYYRHPRSYARRGVFSVDEPSPTVRGVNRPVPGGYRIRPNDPVQSLDGVRPLTTRERSMIQTFPEDFVFAGSKGDLEQMIGNAVPVKLGEFIASAISGCINGSVKPQGGAGAG